MTRHVLKTDGAWVELRDVEDLRAKDRKAVENAVMSAVEVDMDTGRIAAGKGAIQQIINGAPDAVAERLIVGWEIPYLPDAPLPSADPEQLGELRLDDHRRLMELIEPAVNLLMPGRSNNPDDHDDPSSPSEPASD
jgi:hypothetical protein